MLFPRLPVIGVDRFVLCLALLPIAHGQDALGGAFHVNHARAVMAVMQRGHELVLGLERDYIRAGPVLRRQIGIKLTLVRNGQQRPFGRIALERPPTALAREAGIVA